MLGFKIVLLVFIATVAYSLPLSQHEGHPREPAPQCDPGEEDDCSRCYDVLANQVINNDRNRYNMQNAFFPPDKSSPVFITVTYYFTRNMTGNGSTDYSLTAPNETWYWTRSTFYLFQPIESLQYTSLLFSDSSLHKSDVSLYLQPNCQGNNTAMMKLLTQRLKLYAMEQSIAANIDDSYSAKGETLETLRSFHKGEIVNLEEGKHFTKYAFSFQFVFPVVVIVFLGWLFHHLVENNDLLDIRNKSSGIENGPTVIENTGAATETAPENNQMVTADHDPEPATENGEAPETGPANRSQTNADFPHHIENAVVSSTNMVIVLIFVCSYTFVIYVFVLDCLANGYRNERVKETIFHTPKMGPQDDEFKLEYGIPIIMLCYDILSSIGLFIGSICCRCGLRTSWFYLLLSPLFCIVNHSYHILVGFIHNPHHATSILIFYGIVAIVYIVTLRTAYHNLFQFQIRRPDNIIAKFFFSCSKCIFANVFFPCSKFIFGWNWCNKYNCGCECCDSIPKLKWPHPFVLTCLCLLSVFIAGFMVYVVIFFILIPINLAIDDAPDRLLSINQTALIFFGAAITYRLYKDRKNGTVLDYLVKAQNKYEQHANGGTGNAVDGWKTMSPKDKKIKMASRLLGTVDALKHLPEAVNATLHDENGLLTNV